MADEEWMPNTVVQESRSERELILKRLRLFVAAPDSTSLYDPRNNDLARFTRSKDSRHDKPLERSLRERFAKRRHHGHLFHGQHVVEQHVQFPDIVLQGHEVVLPKVDGRRVQKLVFLHDNGLQQHENRVVVLDDLAFDTVLDVDQRHEHFHLHFVLALEEFHEIALEPSEELAHVPLHRRRFLLTALQKAIDHIESVANGLMQPQ